jgi:hypothetical protein
MEEAHAGDPAFGEFRCRGCGYGVSVHRELPRCPMCGGIAWERPHWALDLGQSLAPRAGANSEAFATAGLARGDGSATTARTELPVA